MGTRSDLPADVLADVGTALNDARQALAKAAERIAEEASPSPGAPAMSAAREPLTGGGSRCESKEVRRALEAVYTPVEWLYLHRPLRGPIRD